jgi:heptosyltransferase-2
MTDVHEIQRNLKLLEPLGIVANQIIRPELYIGNEEKAKIDELLKNSISGNERFVALAHGSVWFTKKFPKEKVVRLVESLVGDGIPVMLIGGIKDLEAGGEINRSVKNELLHDFTGKLNVLESAELIRRAEVLITNDSAPLHIGNAVETPVYAIFGSTITGFGFFPYGPGDKVYETNGLSCRPCGIHGKNACPTGTFDCMLKIDETVIARDVIQLFRKA